MGCLGGDWDSESSVICFCNARTCATISSFSKDSRSWEVNFAVTSPRTSRFAFFGWGADEFSATYLRF